MELRRNEFKRALAAGKQQIGLWNNLVSSNTAEVIAGAGFDWMLLDCEHSPSDIESLLGLLRTVAPYPTTPVVRVPWNDMVNIKRMLDIGAQSLLVPFISTADEARAAVSYMRYPPKGVRGVAGTTRATQYGRIKDYVQRVEEELCLLVQVETREGMDNLEEICAVDGVDGVFIGPADLHASYGYVGQTANPEIVPIIEEGMRRIRKAGKAPGFLTSVEADAHRYLGVGAQFVAVGSDTGLLARGAEQLAARFKKA